MTTHLFELWAMDVFFPAIAQRRAQFGYTRMTLLMLDGLGSHHTNEFLQICLGQDIDVLLIPHSSDQIQLPDEPTARSVGPSPRSAERVKCPISQD
jgi:hypothetical protein